MGSVVAYRCGACTYATQQMQIGWGKAGRARYWGGLALCPACKEIEVVNLSESRGDRRETKCTRCNGPIRLIEGMADAIACPKCGKALQQSALGSWS